MKDTAFARNLLVCLVGPLLLLGHLRSQTGLDTKLRVLVERMQLVTSGAVDASSVADTIAAAQAYSDALGKAGERRACELLIEDLRRH
ncbi:MAG: hypothetical protein VYD05_07940, partial [Planctomycetota bacterium]|nr:hypothetical protein [Planctomycetota bacterium]